MPQDLDTHADKDSFLFSSSLSYIDSTLPFTDLLAKGLLNLYGKKQHTPKNPSPFALHDVLVLLPTQRACQNLIHSFQSLMDGQSLILPRIQPIGKIDQDTLFFQLSHIEDESFLHDFLNFPPPIAPLKRLSLLTQLILAKENHTIPLARAFHLAQDLAALLDRLLIEEKTLHTLNEDAIAIHASLYHQDIMAFLKIIRDAWPQILQEEGESDPEAYKNFCLSLQIRLWEKYPPKTPIIIAGSTGSVLSTRKLIACVTKLPYGHVILPGLVAPSSSTLYDHILSCPIHPQYHLYHLTQYLKVKPQNVPAWCNMTHITATPYSTHERLHTIMTALIPPQHTDTWRNIPFSLSQGVKNISRLVAATITEEARAIAFAMRDAIEHNKSVLLVSPNHQLSIAVQAALQTWHIIPDSSLGYHILDTQMGAFMHYVGDVILQNFSPISLMTLFKHPFLSHFIKETLAFEKYVLRGTILNPSIAGYKEKYLANRHAQDDIHEAILSFIAFLEKFYTLSEPLRKKQTFKDFLTHHITLCEWLTEAHRLWNGKEGAAFSAFIQDMQYGETLPNIMTAQDYMMILRMMAQKSIYYDPAPTHPQLKIRPPLEARLHKADLMIIGSLTHEDWGQNKDFDTWLSPAMRTMIGLSDHDEKRALAAHDFVQFFCQSEVILSRSKTIDSKPSLPSMWLAKLEAMLNAHNITIPASHWLDYAILDHNLPLTPCAPPMPSPPLEKRPLSLSVTTVKTWYQDPYSIYAKYILKLKKLDPIHMPENPAMRGQVIHKLFETLWNLYDQIPEKQRLEMFITESQQQLSILGEGAYKKTFQHAEHHNIATWFYTWCQQDKPTIHKSYTEVKGRMIIPFSTGAFTLTARADRIDLMQDGLRIVDYKTGQIPSRKNIATLLEPQIGLELLILLNKGFEGITIQEDHNYTARLMKPKQYKSQTTSDHFDLDNNQCHTLIPEAESFLRQLIVRFYDERAPYIAIPDPNNMPSHPAYNHLSRYQEWNLHNKENPRGQHDS